MTYSTLGSNTTGCRLTRRIVYAFRPKIFRCLLLLPQLHQHADTGGGSIFSGAQLSASLLASNRILPRPLVAVIIF